MRKRLLYSSVLPDSRSVKFGSRGTKVKKNPGSLAEARTPDLLTGPVHPFGSLAALSVPPRTVKSPELCAPASRRVCLCRGRRWGSPPLCFAQVVSLVTRLTLEV